MYFRLNHWLPTIDPVTFWTQRDPYRTIGSISVLASGINARLFAYLIRRIKPREGGGAEKHCSTIRSRCSGTAAFGKRLLMSESSYGYGARALSFKSNTPPPPTRRPPPPSPPKTRSFSHDDYETFSFLLYKLRPNDCERIRTAPDSVRLFAWKIGKHSKFNFFFFVHRWNDAEAFCFALFWPWDTDNDAVG